MALSKIDPAGLDIGQIGGRRNLIINGAMQVAQRGTSSTSGGYSTVDRFTVLKNNMDELEVTASQSTTAPSDQGFPKAYKLDVTTAESALASNENYSIEYRMEGQDLQVLQYGQTNAKTSVLTFYVRSSQTGQYALSVFQEDGGNDLFVANYTINTANTFEKKTITIDGNTAAAIANDNTEGLKLKWWLMAGSDFTSDSSAVGNWVTYTSARYAHGHTVSWGLSASDDFYLTGVQLEVGDTATPFEHISFGEQLALCQRYYQYYDATDRLPAWVASANTGVIFTGNCLQNPMRAQPSVSLTAPAGFDSYYRSSYVQSSANVSRNSGSTRSVILSLGNFSGMISQDNGGIYNTVIKIDAEL